MAPLMSANQDRYIGADMSSWPDRAEALEGRFEHLLNQDLDDFEDQIQRLCKRARSRGSEHFKEKALLEDAAVVDANDGQSAARINARFANGSGKAGSSCSSSSSPSLMRCAAWQQQELEQQQYQQQQQPQRQQELPTAGRGLAGSEERSCSSSCLPEGLLAKTRHPDDSFFNRCVSDALEASSPCSPSCPARSPGRGGGGDLPRCVSVDDAVSWAGRLFSSVGGAIHESLEVLLKSCSAEEFREANRSREGSGGPEFDYQFAVTDAGYQATANCRAGTGSSQAQTRPSTQATTATATGTAASRLAEGWGGAAPATSFPTTGGGGQVARGSEPRRPGEMGGEEAMSCTSSCSVDSFYDGPIAEQPEQPKESTRRRRSYVIPLNKGGGGGASWNHED